MPIAGSHRRLARGAAGTRARSLQRWPSALSASISSDRTSVSGDASSMRGGSEVIEHQHVAATRAITLAQGGVHVVGGGDAGRAKVAAQAQVRRDGGGERATGAVCLQ